MPQSRHMHKSLRVHTSHRKHSMREFAPMSSHFTPGEPGAWYATLPLRTVFEFDPVPSNEEADRAIERCAVSMVLDVKPGITLAESIYHAMYDVSAQQELLEQSVSRLGGASTSATLNCGLFGKQNVAQLVCGR
eukprot:scaffold133460_cov20-Tisochrysis_lutea.AAC.4